MEGVKTTTASAREGRLPGRDRARRLRVWLPAVLAGVICCIAGVVCTPDAVSAEPLLAAQRPGEVLAREVRAGDLRDRAQSLDEELRRQFARYQQPTQFESSTVLPMLSRQPLPVLKVSVHPDRRSALAATWHPSGTTLLRVWNDDGRPGAAVAMPGAWLDAAFVDSQVIVFRDVARPLLHFRSVPELEIIAEVAGPTPESVLPGTFHGTGLVTQRMEAGLELIRWEPPGPDRSVRAKSPIRFVDSEDTWQAATLDFERQVLVAVSRRPADLTGASDPAVVAAVWDVQSGKRLDHTVLPQAGRWVVANRMTRQGPLLIHESGKIYEWQVTTSSNEWPGSSSAGEPRLEPDDRLVLRATTDREGVEQAVYDPETETLLVRFGDGGELQFWQCEPWALIAEQTRSPQPGEPGGDRRDGDSSARRDRNLGASALGFNVTSSDPASVPDPGHGVTAPADSRGQRNDLVWVGTGDGQLIRFQPETGMVVDLLGWEIDRGSSSQNLTAFAVAPEGGWVAAGFDDGSLRLIHAPSGQPAAIRIPHRDRVASIAWGPGARWLVSAGLDGRLVRFDRQPNESTAGAASTATRSGVLAETGNQSESEMVTLNADSPHAGWLLTVTVSPDGRWVATGGYNKTVEVRSAVTGQLIQRWTAHDASVRALAWDASSRWLASGGTDRRIVLYEVATGAEIDRWSGLDGTVRGLHLLSDPSTEINTPAQLKVVSLSEGGRLQLRRVGQQEPEQTVAGLDGAAVLEPVDGRDAFLAGRLDGQIQLVELSTESTRLVGQSRRSPVTGLKWISGSSSVLSAQLDGDVRLWQPVLPRRESEHSAELGNGTRPRSLAWHPEGKVAWSGRGRPWAVWDWTTGQLLECDQSESPPLLEIAVRESVGEPDTTSPDPAGWLLDRGGHARTWSLQGGIEFDSAENEQPATHSAVAGTDEPTNDDGTPQVTRDDAFLLGRLSPEREWVALARGGVIEIRHRHSREMVWQADVSPFAVRDLSWHPAAHELVIAMADPAKASAPGQVWRVRRSEHSSSIGEGRSDAAVGNAWHTQQPWSFPTAADTLQWSNDGERLAIGNREGQVRLVTDSRSNDPATSVPPIVELQAGSAVTALLFLGTEWLAVAEEAGPVTVWSLATNRALFACSSAVPVHRLVFAVEAGRLLGGTQDGRLVDWLLLEEARPVDSESPSAGVAFSRFGPPAASWQTQLAAAIPQRIWKSADPDPLWAGLSPNQEWLAAAGSDQQLRLWMLSSSMRSPDGSSSSDTVEVIAEPAATLKSGRGRIQSAAWSENSQTLVSGDGDGVIAFWDLSSKRLADQARAHRLEIGHVVNAARNGIVSAGRDGWVRRWDAGQRKPQGQWPNFKSPVTAITRLGDHLVIATEDTREQNLSTTLWELTSVDRPPRRIVQLPDSVRQLLAGPGGQTLLVVSSRGRIECRSLADGQSLKSVPVRGRVITAAMIPGPGETVDGLHHQIWVGTADGQIAVSDWQPAVSGDNAAGTQSVRGGRWVGRRQFQATAFFELRPRAIRLLVPFPAGQAVISLAADPAGDVLKQWSQRPERMNQQPPLFAPGPAVGADGK